MELWPSRVGLCWALALFGSYVCGGCTGQDVEGAWRGPFPLEDAKDCRIRLRNDHTFDLSCHSGRDWMGSGTYVHGGNSLTFDFRGLASNGHVARPKPLPICLGLTGGGNSMIMTDPRTRSDLGVWRRVMIQ